MSDGDPTRTQAPDDLGATRTAAPEPDPDATRVKPQDRSLSGATVATVPGYTIEGTLGRGGMGVVYKATQAGLNRVVALKMLIAGQYADPALRARFLLEAESVAALEHPHIIRVFAFGESGGHPYLAMEYLPGGTLAECIKKNGPLPARGATELVAKLANAVAHAHSRGVVHRDIKPLNVLLTAEGEPRLTDFGLAKVGRADQNLSVTGQVLGTPAYMAPEQAAGKVHEVGTGADVYALGAVLYDVLTGRPPFSGDSVAVTLQRVLTEEPQRPRKHNPSIPHDLETICLKCLEKDPAKRYPTAQALADDLLRYHRGEPITVRPAGAIERASKWVRRNKVVSGAAAAVLLALLGGAGVSLSFGLEASRRAEEADAATRREQEEKVAAVAARNDLRAKNDELLQSRLQTSRMLAKALLGPIAEKRGAGFADGEIEAIGQLAGLRGGEIPRMFLEEATRAPLGCRQLDARAEYAFHAVIGLDTAGRDDADRLLRARLGDLRGRGQRNRTLAVAVSKADFVSPDTARLAASVLVEAIEAEARPAEVRTLTESLLKMVGRMEPQDASRFCARVARFFAGRIAASKQPEKDLAGCLADVAARMDPREAHQVCGQVAVMFADALAGGTDPYRQRDLAEGLAALCARMEPGAAARVCVKSASLLAARHALEHDQNRRSVLGQGLTAILQAGTPAETIVGLLDLLESRKVDAAVFSDAMEKLQGRMGHGGSGEEATISRRAFRVITGRLRNSDQDGWARAHLPKVLVIFTGRVADADCAEAARVLAAELARVTFPPEARYLAEALASLAARMDSAEAVKLFDPLVPKLIDKVVPDASDLSEWGDSLTAISPWVDSATAAREFPRLVAVLAKPRTSSFGSLALGRCTAAFAARLTSLDGAEAKRAVEAAIACAKEMGITRWEDPLQVLQIVVSVAPLMEARDAVRALTDTLVAADGRELFGLKDGPLEAIRRVWPAVLLGSVARIPPSECAETSRRAAATFADAFAKASRWESRLLWAQCVAAVCSRMEPDELERVCEPIARAVVADCVSVTSEFPAQLPEVLTALTGRMGRESAARAWATVAERLVDRYLDVTDKSIYSADARCLGIALSRLAPKDARRSIQLLLARLNKAKDQQFSNLSALLREVIGLIEPRDAAWAARTVGDALPRAAMSRGFDDLATAFTALLTKVPPPAAATIRHETAERLAIELSKSSVGHDCYWTQLCLAEVAGGAERGRAFLAAAESQLNTWNPRLPLGLSVDDYKRAQRVPPLTVGAFATQYNLMPAVALLHPHFLPPPTPLPPQDLVELLKHPFCVGGARRAVLDALEFTYQRPFRDQWEFVEYAQKHQPQLDLLTPPKRPEPKP